MLWEFYLEAGPTSETVVLVGHTEIPKQIKGRTLVIDYYHPANYYPALLNYYAVTNIFQQALLYQKEKGGN